MRPLIYVLNCTYLFIIAAFACVICKWSQVEASELQVFSLHSYHQEYPWTKSENEGFVDEFSKAFKDQDITFATEYLDTKRVEYSEEYQLFFRDYLKIKYSSYRPDIIFSTDDNALAFLRQFRQDLFPDVPVIFCGVNTISTAKHLTSNGFAGVYEVKDIGSNISFIAENFPEQRTVLVVGDNSETDLAIRRDIEDFIQEDSSGIAIEFVSDGDLESLVRRLSGKGQGVILLTTIGGLHNENNQPVSLGKSLDRISQAGDFIIVSMEDAYMHEGVLGGYVTSGNAQGMAAARLAATGLGNGSQIPPQSPVSGPNVPTFEYKQLVRLKIPVAKLPPESIVLNTSRSIYKEFKGIIWATVTFIALLLLMLSFMVLNTLRRKSAEKALAESERFLNSVIENIPDMIFVKRAKDLQFVRLNRAGEHLIGVAREEVIGKSDFDLFSSEEAQFFTDKDKEVLRKKVLLEIPEEPIKTPTGIRYLHTQKIPIINRDGEPSYLLGISRDVTKEKHDRQKHKELEERLLQAEKMESIGTLAGGIAHDFNNILSSIIGYSELARIEAENPDKVRTFLDGTLKGAERAKDLIRQILTFSRKSDHQQIPLNLADVTREALKMLRSSLPSTIKIEEELVTEATILADPTQMHQIIFNLCTNAYHAMLEKGGTLAVGLEMLEIEVEQGNDLLKIPAGKYLRLEVGDTGVGMDSETRQRMFDPYYTTKGPEAGTGLGLAVVHGIVKSHHGHIHVYSEKSVGTTIHVYFPILEEQAVQNHSFVEKIPVRGKNEHILLVDDESDIITITETFLLRNGYRVTSFVDGLEALASIRTQPEEYDLLLTDMTMPRITGAELARQTLMMAPTLPVMLCTGHSEIINREKALSMGIRAYCEKPMRGENLLLRLREVLDSLPLS